MKETAQQILDVAQDLVHCRGYSAFSYADISQQVGIAFLTQTVAQNMVDRGQGGAIVNVGSMWAKQAV